EQLHIAGVLCRDGRRVLYRQSQQRGWPDLRGHLHGGLIEFPRPPLRPREEGRAHEMPPTSQTTDTETTPDACPSAFGRMMISTSRSRRVTKRSSRSEERGLPNVAQPQGGGRAEHSVPYSL